MFDLLIEKTRQKMFAKFEKELDEAEEKGESSKVMNFLVRVLPMFVTSICVFLGFLWIFNKLYDKYGLDRIIILFGLIIILTLRSISKTLNRV